MKVCARWLDLLTPGRSDELDQDQRREFLAHLQGCAACRRTAVEADPTLVFSLLPPADVESAEIEDIQHTVQTLRRLRSLEASWSKRSRRGLVLGALAAMILMAFVLIPRRPEATDSAGVPFAGAVGVGSGLVSVPRAVAGYQRVDLQVELARSAKITDLSVGPTLDRISQIGVTANVGERVDQDLGHGYRIRFHLPDDWSGSEPPLRSFQVVQTGQEGEVPLFQGDLQPLPGHPLILGLTPTDNRREQLWLRLTYAAETPRVP